MRQTPTLGLSANVADAGHDDDADAGFDPAAGLACGLVLLLPLLLFAWLCVVCDAVAGVTGSGSSGSWSGSFNAGVDLGAAVTLTALFAGVLRALPPPRADGARATAAR